MLTCRICMRLREGRPLPVEMRQFVIIDSSLFAKDGVCPMYEAKPVARPFIERETESELA